MFLKAYQKLFAITNHGLRFSQFIKNDEISWLNEVHSINWFTLTNDYDQTVHSYVCKCS